MKLGKYIKEGLAMANFSQMDYVNEDMLKTMMQVSREFEREA